ncbi:MAG TPA: SDR family oxidoreductase [Nocardioidaceae bacterium]|jgi:3-dehydrosphinganine reductase
MRNTFTDTHAVVTGGSSGIGLALVRELAACGARVSVLALDDKDLAALAEEPPPGAYPVRTIGADVGDRERLQAAVAEAQSLSGPCDLLVTCAGVIVPGYLTELPDEEFEREMRVNYFGTLWAMRAVAPTMMGRRRGTIMAVSSFAGLVGPFGYGAYSPTKFAVRGLCEVARTELKPYGIHVGCVFPTDTDTPQLAGEKPLKPPEAQISDIAPVLTAHEVAATILDGARRRTARVYPGRRGPVLARLVGALPGLTATVNDRDVARARRKADEQQQSV